MPKSESKANNSSSRSQRTGKDKTNQVSPKSDQASGLVSDSAFDTGFQNALLGNDIGFTSFERHADMLGDPLLAQPMYRRERANIVLRLQRDYGNSYVQRLVERVGREGSKRLEATRDKSPIDSTLQRTIQRYTDLVNGRTSSLERTDDKSNGLESAVQKKLTVGAANDPYEREADQVAKKVLRAAAAPNVSQDKEHTEASSSPQGIQRQQDEEELPLLLKSDGPEVGLEGGDVDSDIEASIQRATGNGEALPDGLRSNMESAFGADFEHVRVHQNTNADNLNRSISARAFTTGSDIFFKKGEYSPGSKTGKGLIAHELTHVVQQGGAGQPATTELQRKTDGPFKPPRDAFSKASEGAVNKVPFRAEMQKRFGQDFSNVKSYTGKKKELGVSGAKAATRGDQVVFAASSPGKETVAHELTHVVQNRKSGAPPLSGIGSPNAASEREARAVASVSAAGGPAMVSARPSGEIQFDGTSMDLAQAKVQADRKYRETAQQLEYALGPAISNSKEANDIANEMLARLRRIVDAWAEATNTGKKKVYEQEFVFPTGKKYYGAFRLVSKEIKRVFDKESQPLRKKLNLVYYAIRNGNFAKYLEVAALELKEAADAQAEGRDPNDVSFRVGKSEPQTAKQGFAEASGLKDIWQHKSDDLNDDRQTEIADIVAKRNKKNPGQTPEVGGRSPVLGSSDIGKKLRPDKTYGVTKGLSLEDQSTLTREDLPDITTSEMRLLYEREGKKQPLWLSKKDKKKFLQQSDTKVLWEQGEASIEVVPNSETRRIAEEYKARLAGGISGSTDLMMHAVNHLGFDSTNDLKRVRLALLGWMLSNRDHSFFEIMRVAHDNGAPFHIDKNDIGSEYEEIDNFYPMPQAKVLNFKSLLPDNEMPSYYASDAYANQLAGGMDKTEDRDAVVNNVKNIINLKNVQDEESVAQWMALIQSIENSDFNTGRTEDELKNNRIVMQALRSDPAYQFLYAKYKKSPDPWVAQIVQKSHGRRAVVKVSELKKQGFPAKLVEPLEEYKKYDLARFSAVVLAAGFDPKSGLSSRTNKKAFDLVKNNIVMEAVKSYLGKQTTNIVMSALLEHHFGPGMLNSRQTFRAAEVPGLDRFITQNPEAGDQSQAVVNVGVSPSWVEWVSKGVRDKSDLPLLMFRLVQLDGVIGAAPLDKNGSPTSRTNRKAFKSIEASREFQELRGLLRLKTILNLEVTLIKNHFGEALLTDEQKDVAFKDSSKSDKLEGLTDLGLPRDFLDIEAVSASKLQLAVEKLRRVVKSAKFSARGGPDSRTNRKVRNAITQSPAFADVKKYIDRKDRLAARKADVVLFAMIRHFHGEAALRDDDKLLADAAEQRMAREDKERQKQSGKQIELSDQEVDDLETPSLKSGAQIDEEKYWGIKGADAQLKKSIQGTSPSILTQFQSLKDEIVTDAGLRTRIEVDIASTVEDLENRAQTLANLKGVTPEVLIGLMQDNMPTEKILNYLPKEISDAIEAIEDLTDRERGALFMYTTRLHTQMGYATQFFSRSDNFDGKDVENVTSKLRSLKFMMPVLKALQSGLEKLPAYSAGPVYNGSDSHKHVDQMSDKDKQRFAAKAYPPGKILAYSYPLSTAKDVGSSFIFDHGMDIAVVVDQPLQSGKDVEYLSNKPKEKEVLFPQGVRFKVVETSLKPKPRDDIGRDTKHLWVYVKEV